MFYSPPNPLPNGAPGAVIWSQPLTGVAAMGSAAKNILVTYHSRTLAGNDVAVTGIVAIPPGKAPEGGWPVITWTHGTTGLGAQCAPSRDTENGPEHEYLKIVNTLLDGYVKRGFVVVESDYEGLGTRGVQPFMIGRAVGQNALDIIRAARQLEPAIGKRYIVMGHSQGGHADLFTAAIAPEYAPELTLVADVAMAPGSHAREMIVAMTNSQKVMPMLPYVMYVLNAYAANNPAIDLTRILTPEANAHLPELRRQCMSQTQAAGYWATAIPKDQFQAGADLSAVLKMADENDPSKLKISVPSMVAQGKTDTTVVPEFTEAVVKGLCSGGNTIEFREYAGKDHDGVITASAGDVEPWLAARWKGEATRGNCGK